MLRLVCFLTALLLLAVPGFAADAGHYCEGQALRRYPPSYESGYRHAQEMSAGDVIFPSSFPAESSLTWGERFLICSLEAPCPDLGFHNYSHSLFAILQNYYSKHKSVPPALTEEVIREVYSSSPTEYTDKLIKFMKSPITGELPRLDAQEFAAGQLYVKRLAFPEILRISKYNHTLDQVYMKRRLLDVRSGDEVPGEVTGEVFYIRMYGHSGIISAGVKFASAPR
jgi:hypothetical protein